MYPRNAAAPEPIAIGAVVQISDGVVQTSGCTVRIKPIGVAEADGGGTTAYSTDGIVLYTPTQAETNYTSFVLIAKKTGCIPVSITVVTTESAVSGRVSLGMIAGDTQSATDLKDFADAGYDPATNKVQGVVLVDTLTTYTSNTPQTGDVYAIANSGTHGNAALKTLIDTVDDFLDTEVAAIKAKTDNLPSDPADQSAVEAAITAAVSGLASQTSVNDLPTNAELATALSTADDAVLAAIAGLPVPGDATAANQTTILSALTTIDDFLDTEVAAIKAKTDNLPTDPADQSAVEAAITAAASSLSTAASVAALKVVADKIATVIYGTVTGAGTATEVFVSAGYTVTVTVDASGNRSAVVIT